MAHLLLPLCLSERGDCYCVDKALENLRCMFAKHSCYKGPLGVEITVPHLPIPTNVSVRRGVRCGTPSANLPKNGHAQESLLYLRVVRHKKI
jgi:hypothetical protein